MQLSSKQKEELKKLVLPLVDDLHRVALSLSHREDIAQELVAATVASACESFHRLRDPGKTKQWLLRILSNKFLTQHREKARHKEVPFEDEFDNEDGNFSLFEKVSQPFLLWWGNPERELVAQLLDEDIRKAVESLPTDFRIAVVLCDIEGLSYQEITDILNIPMGTVRSRIARGRSLLQKKLWHHAQDLGLVKSRKHNHETAPQELSQNH